MDVVREKGCSMTFKVKVNPRSRTTIGVVAMVKFILTAESPADIINLLTNTRDHYRDVRWNPASVCVSKDESPCSEYEVSTAILAGDMASVDNAIMGGDVPVGGLVVVYDGETAPVNGFVCGNGNEWYIVPLELDVLESIVERGFCA